MIWLAVAVRILANPLSNVFQKLLTGRGEPPLLVVGATHGLLTLICLPVLFVEAIPDSFDFWANAVVAAVLAVAGNSLLVRAVELSDLSVLGPVNSYKPVVGLVAAILLLGELPSLLAFVGIGLIVAGSYFVLDASADGRNFFVRFAADRGVRYRIAALVLSATEAVYLKRALLLSSPFVTFALWSILGWVLAFAAFALINRFRFGELKSLSVHRWTYLLLGLTTGLMQLMSIIVFGGMQVAPALALFQTSTLVSVLLGWRVFREKNIPRRLFGSVVMTAGAVFIVLKR